VTDTKRFSMPHKGDYDDLEIIWKESVKVEFEIYLKDVRVTKRLSRLGVL
jgi:hypothetical protein